MNFHTPTLRRAIRVTVLLVGASVAAIASQSPMMLSKTRLCYCTCTHPGGKPCTKMCDLPQFQNRWWATSCQKKKSPAIEPSAPASNPESRKTNRAEEAHL
jgi:hypothetical protein